MIIWKPIQCSYYACYTFSTRWYRKKSAFLYGIFSVHTSNDKNVSKTWISNTGVTLSRCSMRTICARCISFDKLELDASPICINE